jgi:hypothetical protein
MILLGRVGDKISRAIWRLLSLVITTEIFPAESLAPRVDFNAILLEMDSIVPGMSTATLELVVYFAARGALFVDALAAAGLFDFSFVFVAEAMLLREVSLFVSRSRCRTFSRFPQKSFDPFVMFLQVLQGSFHYLYDES